MSKGNPVVILVRPQMGENIGAAGRVMANFGLSEMRIVNPRDGWPNERAWNTAAGAKSIIDAAKIYDEVPEAMAGLNRLYATSARPREMIKPVMSVKQAVEEARSLATGGQEVGFLFGPEKTGLTNEELSLADVIITVATSEVYPSLNLAQAVAIVTYEYYQLSVEAPDVEAVLPRHQNPASKQELQGLFEHLEAELDAHDFYNTEEIRPKMIQNIRAMLTRAGLTDQEVRTLRGMIRALVER